jgi:group I intron endonuclease
MNYTDAGYVYAIQNTLNGGMYVGSTTAFKSRWHTHKSALRRGVHHSFVLQRAWDKYGEPAFEFKILVVCPRSERIQYENRLMPLQRYNVLRTAKESLVRGGWTHGNDFKKKMSALHKGKKLSEEHKKKISLAAMKREYGDEFREKASRRQLGISPSAITRKRISGALIGRTVSGATRVKLKAAQQARGAATAEKFLAVVSNMAARVASGSTVLAELSANKMSSATYYKYVKLLAKKVDV